MPWTKQVNVTETAQSGVDDISMRLYRADASTPPAKRGINLETTITLENGEADKSSPVNITLSANGRDAASYLADTGITAAERSTLFSILAKLRDKSFSLAGFTFSP